MHLTANAIMTDGGQHLPLQRDFRDALSTYARLTWPTNTVKSAAIAWKLPVTTAANLIKGHASDSTITHVLRAGGWKLAVFIVGAVIGESLDTFIQTERRRAADERRKLEARDRRLSEMARDLPPLARMGPASGSELGGEPRRRRGSGRG